MAARLPPGWAQQTNKDGKIFYANSIRKTTQWAHPLATALPPGWRIRFDHEFQPYYINTDFKTQWELPTVVAGGGVVDNAAMDRLERFLSSGTVADEDGRWIPSTDGATPSSKTRWEVWLDSGKWYRFDGKTNALVGKAIKNNRPDVDIGHKRHVNWLKGTQTRTDTGKVRPIRPVHRTKSTPPTSPKASCDSGAATATAAAAGKADAGASGALVTWEVQTDSGWMRYSPAHAALLERAFATGTETVELSTDTPMGKFEYVIHLKARTQTRKKGKSKVREVRRTPPAAAPPSGAAAAAGSSGRPLQWQVSTDAGWVGYLPEHSAEISGAVRAGKSSVEITIITGTGPTQYTVSLDAAGYSQCRSDGTGKPRAVRPAPPLPPGAPWEVETDAGWVQYSRNDCAAISAAEGRGDTCLHLVVATDEGPIAYVIELEAKGAGTQRRADGNGQIRAIRNPLALQEEASAAASASADIKGTPTEVVATPPGASEAGAGADASATAPAESSPPSPRPIPDDLLCPISMVLLKDPVVAADGFTYERSVITQWLETNDLSPLTGATLEHKMLVPNNTIKALIAAEGYTE